MCGSTGSGMDVAAGSGPLRTGDTVARGVRRRLGAAAVVGRARLDARNPRVVAFGELSLAEALKRPGDANAVYQYFHHYFGHRAPAFVREHREEFRGKGFGEDAFHAMWWLLLVQERPSTCLEIGVFRGQTISLWSRVMTVLGLPHEVHGISPLTATGDSVSDYPDLDYETDVRRSFARLGLQPPNLLRALSNEPAAEAHIASRTWDLVYIDGSHEEQVVRSDYEVTLAALRPGGLLVFDDAALGSGYDPPPYAFAGHAGPSAVVRSLVGDARVTRVGAVGHNVLFRKT